MKPARCPPSSRPSLPGEQAELRARLAEAEETLRAICSGEVDAVVVASQKGPQVFTLEGAEHAYRLLIESMHEGALTLTADMMVLYANQCFAQMVQFPLEQVLGSSFRRFLSAKHWATLQPLLTRTGNSGSKMQVLLKASDGSQMPVQVSIRQLPKNGSEIAPIGMVVADLSQARRSQELLQALTQCVVQAQEAERGRIAIELHDNVTQRLCATLVCCQTLAKHFSPRDGPSEREARELSQMLGQTAEETERISRNLRPSVLAELGLVAVLTNTGAAFTDRTGVSLNLACVRLTGRLPPSTELALYRIFQEALSNVEKHACARHVAVRLTRQRALIELVIKDDGIGFDPDHAPSRTPREGLGLLSMRERAAYVGGTLKVKSLRGAGTEIEVRIPLSGHRRGASRGFTGSAACQKA